jgi:hypothetical protein
MDYIKRLRNLSKMNKWDFVVSELKSLQQDIQDDQAIAELFVEQKLLYGYNIIKSKDQVYKR